MALAEQIDQDLTLALKAGDQAKLSVLRMVKSALKNQQIAAQHELSDEEVLKVLQKEAKQRKESIDSFEAGGRAEIAAKEKQELEVIESYLPAGLSDEELSKMVNDAISETGASTMADMGKVMGALSAKVQGRADGSKLAELVKQQLAS